LTIGRWREADRRPPRGYCFEQNGLLERALREIGFNVRSLLGRVVLANPPQMPPRTHRLLLVEVAGERWIADVGFGGQTLTAPIKLLADIPQQTPHGSYRLVHEGDEWTLQFNHHEHWQSMYHFDLGRQYASDYVMGNFWSAHWPQSHFRHHLLMSSSAGRRQNDPHQFPLYPLGE
jgi:N-hydroxyarylamine O-acetyltransferase